MSWCQTLQLLSTARVVHVPHMGCQCTLLKSDPRLVIIYGIVECINLPQHSTHDTDASRGPNSRGPSKNVLAFCVMPGI